MLLSQHNLFFYGRMMREIRQAITDNNFDAYYEQFYETYTHSAKN